MRRIILAAVSTLAVFGALAGFYWTGALQGWFGSEQDAGVIQGRRVPDEVIASRTSANRSAAAPGETKQILFGDLHVHTTFSADAFQVSLPLLGGTGVHPLSDACDFARYCSAIDFWASTDHAESITPLRWQRVKESVRACQRVAGDGDDPDLVSFIGFEWTQVGRLPEDHFGHKNVIFRDLDDDKVSARPIAAAGAASDTLRRGSGLSPIVPLGDFSNRQVYFDFNKFTRLTQAAPDCDSHTTSDKLPTSCFESAARPSDLVRKLVDEQKLNPLIIPHGTSWGFYTPPGTTWNKALDPKERPDAFRFVEIFSGHGNSEEYRSWQDVVPGAGGAPAVCPRPVPSYTPSCWRAGEIIRNRCLKAKINAEECEKRAAKARDDYADMGRSGFLSVPGAQVEDWLDAGQCTDCFLPPFNHRPGTSVQAGLATTHFDGKETRATRFDWGFIGSSDNHRARPGTGYKQVDRRQNTEASGAVSSTWRGLLAPAQSFEDEDPASTRVSQDKLATMSGLQVLEFERQSAFFMTGGLAAVHAEGRSRAAIWDALQRREVYATTGQRTLLWFNATDKAGTKTPMGSHIAAADSPTFEVHAAGSFKQKPGCPDFAKAGLDDARIGRICSGECYNPTDERHRITRIEVVKIRPQSKPGEGIAPLIQDPYVVHQCKPDAAGCTFTFSDPAFAEGKRDSLYYVKAIQESEPMINAQPIKCERDTNGKCIKAALCFGDYRGGKGDCTAPAEPRAWSSPIYVDFRPVGSAD
jgi:hypothetical protein